MRGDGPSEGRDGPAAGRSARDGFTLVEVMLAAVILGVGLAVLMTAASRCLLVMKAARNYQEAQWVLGLGEADHPMAETNDLEDLNVAPTDYPNGCAFSREVEKDDEDEDGLHVVRTRVTWTQRGHEMKEEIVSYVFRETEK
jgi:prepilin-type N-terminal cleavage/methylation domain-containing protein